MIIQINTDKNIIGGAALNDQVEAIVRTNLQYVHDKITRVEVHLSDENGDAKFGTDDKQCRLEARLAGRQPILVSHHAATVEQSLTGAAGKLKRAVDTILGRLDSH